jgi:hypothetical protein
VKNRQIANLVDQSCGHARHACYLCAAEPVEAIVVMGPKWSQLVGLPPEVGLYLALCGRCERDYLTEGQAILTDVFLRRHRCRVAELN